MFEFWTFNINKIKLGLGPNATPSNNVSTTRGMMVSRGRVSAASTDSVGSGGSSGGGGGGPLSSNQNLYNTSHVHNMMRVIEACPYLNIRLPFRGISSSSSTIRQQDDTLLVLLLNFFISSFIPLYENANVRGSFAFAYCHLFESSIIYL
ncbi:hypothetical protein RDWZM_004955 [Blomia tropicalis]|uniref:Uncharacterized protein n=1 Tax=Blomia tropicalis TaxID=40697 RepID=A0A9Q0RKG2_BLOTA|nr:hypothetical protein RDWZM_004955 [Blomia tropicalis]